MKKKLVLLCMIILFVGACGTNASETDSVKKNIKKEENVFETEDNFVETEIFFEKKIQELVDTYGCFKSEQSAIIHTPDDEWLDPTGIVSTTISAEYRCRWRTGIIGMSNKTCDRIRWTISR